MSDKPMSQSRRDAVKLMLGTAVAIPVVNLIGLGSARAEALPEVLSDPAMKSLADALGYVEDFKTSEAHKAKPMATDGTPQACHNCSFGLPIEGSDRLSCTLFSQHSVNKNGWCQSWQQRA